MVTLTKRISVREAIGPVSQVCAKVLRNPDYGTMIERILQREEMGQSPILFSDLSPEEKDAVFGMRKSGYATEGENVTLTEDTKIILGNLY